MEIRRWVHHKRQYIRQLVVAFLVVTAFGNIMSIFNQYSDMLDIVIMYMRKRNDISDKSDQYPITFYIILPYNLTYVTHTLTPELKYKLKVDPEMREFVKKLDIWCWRIGFGLIFIYGIIFFIICHICNKLLEPLDLDPLQHVHLPRTPRRRDTGC